MNDCHEHCTDIAEVMASNSAQAFFFFFFFFFQALFSLQLITTKIAFIFTSMNIPDISVHFSRFTVL